MTLGANRACPAVKTGELGRPNKLTPSGPKLRFPVPVTLKTSMNGSRWWPTPLRVKSSDDAQVEVCEGRLAHAVARGLCAVDDGAVVPIVGVVLGVEADERRVGLAGARYEDRVEFETDRQVDYCTQVEVISYILKRVGALDVEVVWVQRRSDAVRPEV